MSQEQIQLKETTQRLLHGPLKHVRAAALAAALLPLASVVATPASAQDACSGGFCGYVWEDTNKDGIRDASEPFITRALVTIDGTTEDGITIHQLVATGTDGVFKFFFTDPLTGERLQLPPGTYTVSVQIPPGTQASTPNVGTDVEDFDSDGVPSTDGVNSVATVTYTGGDPHIDFGFWQTAPAPGTGTPGYWKNHPEAWPAGGITVGGVTYSTAVAISWLDQVGKDKTTTMFSSLVSAKLNVLFRNNAICVESTIAAADLWMETYPLGSKVAASSYAWKVGEPLHRLMDNYNNGMLCAPHRD